MLSELLRAQTSAVSACGDALDHKAGHDWLILAMLKGRGIVHNRGRGGLDASVRDAYSCFPRHAPFQEYSSYAASCATARTFFHRVTRELCFRGPAARNRRAPSFPMLVYNPTLEIQSQAPQNQVPQLGPSARGPTSRHNRQGPS